jgi:hypothetical protein
VSSWLGADISRGLIVSNLNVEFNFTTITSTFNWAIQFSTFKLDTYATLGNLPSWVQIPLNMFCLFLWHKKRINLCRMDLISISTIWSSQIHYNNVYWLSRTLVIIVVISKFYWEQTLYKGNILRDWWAMKSGPFEAWYEPNETSIIFCRYSPSKWLMILTIWLERIIKRIVTSFFIESTIKWLKILCGPNQFLMRPSVRHGSFFSWSDPRFRVVFDQ